VAKRHSSLSGRVYALLLRLFPGEFQADFAEQMAADFRDQCLDAERTGGRAALVRVWIRTAVDVLRRAPAEQLDVVRRDAGYALRLLRRNPLFALTAILTLAFAIGVNTTIFSIVDGMLFKPMPYHQPDRLVMLRSYTMASDQPAAMVPKLVAVALRERHSGLVDVAAVRKTAPLTLLGTTGPESFDAVDATSNLLNLLGVVPVVGRSFTADDWTAPEGTALLSHVTWTARFGADPSVVDRVISFEEGRVRIVGVLPKDFVVPSLDAKTADLLLAVDTPFRGPADSRELTLHPIARLKSNVTLAAAQAEVDVLVTNLIKDHPDVVLPGQGGFQARLMELQFGLFESRRSVLWTLFCGAGLVLVIACVNLANLLLSRAAGRDREIAVRMAIGASRLRLIQQLVMESAVLALLGGAAGVLLAWWSFDLVIRNIPPVFVLLLPDRLDGRAVIFSAFATGFSVFFFGAVPALRSSRVDLVAGLQERRRALASRRFGNGRVLVAVETVIVTVLVIAAVLMVGSFGHLRNAGLGFEPDGLRSVEIRTSPSIPNARLRDILLQVTNAVRSLPEVVSVAAEDGNPIGIRGFVSESARLAPGRRTVQVHRVSASYFDTMKMRLVAGRFPSDGEGREGSIPALITERAAQALGGSEHSVGKTVELLRGPSRATVIGVVGDIRLRYDDTEPREVVFVPLPENRPQAPGLIVRAPENQPGLEQRIRAIVMRVSPRTLADVAPLRTQLDASLALSRFQAQLLGAFAMLAVLLAIVGIHGVLAQVVAGSTREIGIRMALGATSGGVRRLVIAHGVVPVVIGLMFGVIAGFWIVQVFRSYVHGVKLHDPSFFAVAAVIVMITALVGAWIPASRATRVDPVMTLRAE